MSKFDYLSELDIDELLDMHIEAADDVKQAQESKRMVEGYPALLHRQDVLAKSASELAEAIRAEIKRRAKS